MQKFNILAGLCSSTDRFEPYLVGNPEDWFSRDEAKTYVVGTQKNRLNETVNLST